MNSSRTALLGWFQGCPLRGGNNELILFGWHDFELFSFNLKPNNMITQPQREDEIASLRNAPDLEEFIGTENYYPVNELIGMAGLYPKINYTDGIHYLIESRDCMWLIKMICHKVSSNSDLFSNQDFMRITLKKESDQPAKHKLIFTDGNYNVLDEEEIENQNVQDESVNMFLTDNVLMLTSEY